MKKFIITFLVIIVLGGAVVALVAMLNKKKDGAANVESKPEETIQVPDKLKGYSFSPKSTAAADFIGFFEKVAEGGNTVTWAGAWRDLEKGAPVSIMSQATKNGLTSVIISGVYNQGADILYESLTEDNISELVDIAKNFAEKNKPAFFVVGVEMNIMYEKRPQDFDKFVVFYERVFDAIKEISPDTKVGTAFQLERIKGLRGGLFGGTNDTNRHDWALLARFSKGDFVGFTTYPGLVFKDPTEIPLDYYSEIKNKMTLPVLIVESGWHAEDQGLGEYAGTSEKQDVFVQRFFELTSKLDLKMVIWSFLYDPDVARPFQGTGLITRSGAERPAYQTWKESNL